eukprot:SAG31_NODE_302_length_18087_cov_97.056982_15_plen_150_part_00
MKQIVIRSNLILLFVLDLGFNPTALCGLGMRGDVGHSRVYDRMIGTVLLERCIAAEVGVISKAAGRSTSKWAPVPLATVEFQKRASRWLRISSEEAMKVAEALYQRGLLSYPRTETDVFNESIDLRAIIQVQTANSDVADYVSRLLSNG